MSRYFPLSGNSKTTLTPANYGSAEPFITKRQAKMEKSYNVAGGSSGTTGNSQPGKMVGEY